MINQDIALKLVKIYDFVCEKYEDELQFCCERFSKNSKPDFSDQEIMTIYLFCTYQEQRVQVKQMYNFVKNYLLDWFPQLPSYEAFSNRLNRLSEAFKYLIPHLLGSNLPLDMSQQVSLIDSMPIETCSAKRQAKVATNLTDKSYCASKKRWYYGLKIHVLGFETAHQMPYIEHIIFSKASEHDLAVLKENLDNIHNRTIFADKAYCDKSFQRKMQEENNIHIITPMKSKKSQSSSEKQFDKAFSDVVSRAISSVRQPIESLFSWLIQKTDIQRANRVRSEKGLLVHVFGKIAAACLKFIF